MLSSVEGDESLNYTKQPEDVQNFTYRFECRFSMDGECERLRMKESTNELASLISSLNLGSEELHVEEYVQLAGDKTIVDAKYNMIELVNLTWGRKCTWI